jgi:lipopolysaccharide export system protein LptC
MLLKMDQKRAEGDNEVLLTGRGSKTTGSGFELDLVANTATVKGNVKTQYE